MGDGPARSIPGEILRCIDPGWLFLLPGLALIAWVVILPAQDDLAHADWLRDQVRAEEVYRGEQLASYASFIDAIHMRDPKVIRWLAASQLNMTVDAHTVVGDEPVSMDAGVFGVLNPAYEAPAPPRAPESLLHRLAVGPRSRLWLILAGAVCVFYGLLPPARD